MAYSKFDINFDQLSFAQYLTSEELILVKENSNIVRYNKNDNIFLQQTRTSHIMFIVTGLVKIFKEARGNHSNILRIDKDNSFIGLMSTFGLDTHQYSGSAIEPTNILIIDINTFKNIIHTNGAFAHYIIHQLSIDGLYIFEKLINHTYKQLPGRIADVILYFSEQIYMSERFDFPITRRELAEFAGTTKESFIRTLTEFKNDKIIELDGSTVIIKSMKIIKTLSELG
jgi:CRP-like cAMP-binding protein